MFGIIPPKTYPHSGSIPPKQAPHSDSFPIQPTPHLLLPPNLLPRLLNRILRAPRSLLRLPAYIPCALNRRIRNPFPPLLPLLRLRRRERRRGSLAGAGGDFAKAAGDARDGVAEAGAEGSDLEDGVRSDLGGGGGGLKSWHLSYADEATPLKPASEQPLSYTPRPRTTDSLDQALEQAPRVAHYCLCQLMRQHRNFSFQHSAKSDAPGCSDASEAQG